LQITALEFLPAIKILLYRYYAIFLPNLLKMLQTDCYLLTKFNPLLKADKVTELG